VLIGNVELGKEKSNYFYVFFWGEGGQAGGVGDILFILDKKNNY